MMPIQPTQAGSAPPADQPRTVDLALRHIKGRRTDAGWRPCKISQMGLLILVDSAFAPAIVATARRAPRDGYFERMLTLYFSCCTLLRAFRRMRFLLLSCFLM